MSRSNEISRTLRAPRTLRPPRTPSPPSQGTSLETKERGLRKRSSSEKLNKSVGESPSKRKLFSFQDMSDSEDSGPNREDSDEMEELDFSRISLHEDNTVFDEDSYSDLTEKFSVGDFIVLKHDFHMRTNYPIWRIEEKSVQRFIPIIMDGKKLYRNANHYQEWEVFQKDQYYSVPVKSVSECETDIIVELDFGLIKS